MTREMVSQSLDDSQAAQEREERAGMVIAALCLFALAGLVVVALWVFFGYILPWIYGCYVNMTGC